MLIDEALQRARLAVKMPGTLIMMGAWGQALVLGSGMLLAPPWLYVSLALGVLGWPLAVLYGAVMTPRWRLWAYAEVANVRALKDAAIAARLIPPENSFFEKIEICSAGQRLKILKFEGRA